MQPAKIKVKLTIDNKDDFVITAINEPKYLRKADFPIQNRYIYELSFDGIGASDCSWLASHSHFIRGKQFKFAVFFDGEEMSSLSNTIYDMTVKWELTLLNDVFTYRVTLEFISEEPPLIADDLYLDSVPDSAWTDKIHDGVVHGSIKMSASK